MTLMGITSNGDLYQYTDWIFKEIYDDWKHKSPEAYDKYLSDLLEFTKVEGSVEKDLQYKLFHKETSSEKTYKIEKENRIDLMIVDFYCDIKKISWFKFQELFTQARIDMGLEKQIYLIKIRTGRSGPIMDRLLEMAERKTIRTQLALDNERLTEIVDAIVRYRKSEMAVPTEWIEEYNTIIERIKNNPK